MDLNAFAHFHFLYPRWLFTIPALALVAAWFLWRTRHAGRWDAVVEAGLIGALRLEEGRRRGSPWLPLGIAWILAALALAGPAWRRVESTAYREPADWLVLLDLSPSMNAADLAPNRITRAHYLIDDLLNAAGDARVGLVAFAGEAHTVVPLTTDVATIRALLQPLVPSIMPESGHDLAPALEQAAALLRQTHSRDAHLIVLTDGLDDPAQALAAAAGLAKSGAHLEVVGVGTTAGAPEPDGSGGFAHDAAGKLVLAKLPVDLLQRLAAAGAGRYWSSAEFGDLVHALRADGASPLEDVEAAKANRVDAWRNEGYWLILPLLLVGASLARRGWL